MDASYKKAKTSNYISLKKLEYDDNSQNVIQVNKTPLIAKVNNGNLKLTNNERCIIKKVDKNTKEIIIKNDRNEIKIKADEFQIQNYLELVMPLQLIPPAARFPLH